MAQLISLTSDQKIMLELDRLKRSIQEMDTMQVFSIIGETISVKEMSVDARVQMRSIFEKADSRGTEIYAPPNARSKKLWDFEITCLEVQFIQDSTEAVLDCKLKFWAKKAVIPPNTTEVNEHFYFKRSGDGWKLVGFDNLLDFLWEEVNSIEKE
jgi:hypothetical protein